MLGNTKLIGKSTFVRKKRLLQTYWMLRGLIIKDNMKGSSIIGGRNLKGYKARDVFKSKKARKKKRKEEERRMAIHYKS